MRRSANSIHRLIGLFAAASALVACVDPHRDYDDFKARPFAETVSDAAAPDVPLTSCEALLRKDLAGLFFVSCKPTITGTDFQIALTQSVTNTASGSDMQISFTLLDINAETVDELVGEPHSPPLAHISSDCAYDLEIGDLTIPEASTTLGGEVHATGVKLRSLLQTPDRSCGNLEGQVVSPIPLDLNAPKADGTRETCYCMFQRVSPGATIVKPSEWSCPPPAADN